MESWLGRTRHTADFLPAQVTGLSCLCTWPGLAASATETLCLLPSMAFEVATAPE